jgi:Spy/CpxP family protein refolding chaperone
MEKPMKLMKPAFLALMAGGLLAAGSASAQNSAPAPSAQETYHPATNTPVIPAAPPRFDMGAYLKLTDAQKPQVEPIIAADRQQRMAVMQDGTLAPADKRAKIIEIRNDTTAKLQKLLTPDQFARWQRMQQPRMRRVMTPMAPVASTNAPAVHAPTAPAPAQ